MTSDLYPFISNLTGLSTLDEEVLFYKAHAMASSTQKTRQGQWRKYFTFCDEYDLKPLPANGHQVCRFLVYLAPKLKYSSINNYLSGLICLHKMFGYDQDFRLDFRVIFTLQGLKRVLGDTTCRKSPILPADLIRMHKLVDIHLDLDLAIWSCVILSFRTLLRKSNLLPSPNTEAHCVKRNDITFTDWGFLVRINSSKTIQFKQRQLEIPVVSAPGSPLCAVSLLRAHLTNTASAGNDCPLFMIKRGDGLVPLDYPTALARLKSWASVVCPEKDVGFHSLRRGAATHMSMIGVRLEDIKTAGDWASLAVLVYLTTPLSHKISVDNIVVDSLY